MKNLILFCSIALFIIGCTQEEVISIDAKSSFTYNINNTDNDFFRNQTGGNVILDLGLAKSNFSIGDIEQIYFAVEIDSQVDDFGWQIDLASSDRNFLGASSWCPCVYFCSMKNGPVLGYDCNGDYCQTTDIVITEVICTGGNTPYQADDSYASQLKINVAKVIMYSGLIIQVNLEQTEYTATTNK